METFANVDLYILICKILDLKPAETDGKLSRVKPMLREKENIKGER